VTAIGNRRFFDASFMEEVEKARRLGDHRCLALADIDKFKHVNDRFGHLVGDRLLRLFANILVQNVRGQDKVARFGGEEFALIFPGPRLGEAVTAVERIRLVLESKQWTIEPSGERVGKVTASFGVAKLRADESPNDLLRRVDERLYEAKVQGRNRVVADDPNDETSQSSPRDRAPWRADALARSRPCPTAAPMRFGAPSTRRAGRTAPGMTAARARQQDTGCAASHSALRQVRAARRGLASPWTGQTNSETSLRRRCNLRRVNRPDAWAIRRPRSQRSLALGRR
jgi:diguanylate cyclase (GGDEF)-like protein